LKLENLASEKRLALDAAYEKADQLQYEAESEIDDNVKAEKFAAYEKAFEEADVL